MDESARGAAGHLNILQTTVDQLSGVDVQAESLQERFHDRGHNSDLMPHWFDGEFGVIQGDRPREDYADLDTALGALRDDYDVVHFHSQSFHDFELGEIQDALGDTPMVYTAHSAVEYDEPTWYQDLQLEYMREADVITTVSRYAKERLLDMRQPQMDAYDVARAELEEKVKVVPNGTDFDKYVDDEDVAEKAAYVTDEWIEQFAPDAERVILFAGRHSVEKGLDDLARAFDMIGDQEDYEDTVLIYAGANGKSDAPAPETMNWVASQIDPALRDRVRFTGRVERDELAALMKAADVFVTPTSEDYDNETFNMTISESLMMDTPVVTSDKAAPRELFVNPGYAIGVEPSNPRSIADGVRYVLDHPEEAKERTQSGKEHVMRNYTMESVSEQWLDEVYRPLAGVSGGGYRGVRAEEYSTGSDLTDSPF